MRQSGDTMKQQRVIFGFLIFLAGCSSAPKNSTANATKGKAVEAASSPAQILPARTETAPPPATATPTSGLQEAIRNGSDEGILRSGSEVLGSNPTDPTALNAMGLAELRKGRALAAQYFFDKAIAANPQVSAVHNNLALAFLAQQKEREAIRELRKAVEINPHNFEAAGNLGSLYLGHRDFRRAYVFFEMGFPSSPKDVKWLQSYAITSAWIGKLEQAESLYKQALSQSSSQREVLFNYAIFKVEYAHKYQEGLELIDRIKVLGPTESERNALNLLENRAKAGLK